MLMKKYLLLFALMIVGAPLLHAQKQVDIQPLSWKGKITLSDHAINTVIMPGIDMAAIHAEDAVNDASGNVQRMTVLTDVNYNLNNAGTWFQLPNGDKVWKFRLESPDALGISLLFDHWHIPAGGQLHIYNEAHTDLLGAYTSENNKTWGGMAVQHILGDVLIMEYYEPAEAAGQSVLNIDQVGHAYRQIYRIPNQLELPGDLRGSDPCEVDVNCSEGNNWQDEKKGVCRILVASPQGQGWCSGSLINNTSLDCAPYVLTALHCGESSTTANFNSYIFYFNYESSGCGSGNAPTNQSVTGCTKLADSGDGGGNNGSDFLLVELNANNISQTLQNYGAYWNGWSAVNSGSPSGVSIHHPAGDRKKISTYTQTLSSTTWGGTPNTHWLVDWVGTANGHGVTEGGSSGSPIFDNNKRIVGQLTGGASFCNQVPNTSPDRYGKMSYNWNSNPGDDLDDYLDPGNTGATTLDGTFYPCAPTSTDDAGITQVNSPNGTVCGATFTPSVILRNFGSSTLSSVTITYDVDGGTPLVYNWTGSLATGATETVALNPVSTSGGSHTFNVATSNPNGVTDGNAANDAQSTTFTVNTTGVQVEFTLNTDCWGSETTWEVQNSSGATIASGGPYTDVAGGETITETWCLADGCYDFIINDSYGDGMYGSQYQTCSVDGNYTIVDQASGTTLASILATNSDFGNSETNNFCVSANLAAFFTTNNTTVCAGTTVNFTDQSSGGPTSWNWSFPGGSPATSTAQNPSVTYNTPGTYDVTLSVSDGSNNDSNTETGYITVVSTPTATASGTNETCDGDCDGTASATVSGGTAPYSYNWSNGGGSGQNISGLCAGTYNLVLTDDNGCTATGASHTVSAGAASPTAGFTASATTVFLSSGATIDFTNTSTGGNTNAWDFGDGNSSALQDPSHTFGTVGTFTVTLTVTNQNGCSDVFTMQITVQEVDGITESQLNAALSMFPNPTTGNLNVNIDVADADMIYVEVFNAVGKRLQVVNVNEGQRNIDVDLTSFASGLYYVTVYVDEAKVTRRISLIK